MPEQPLTYAAAGVDIDEAERALRSLVPAIQATHSDRVLGGVGGFGGLFRAAFPEMADPILVSSIDGVGTKTKVAAMAGDYSGIGADIVNHCVNDILCQGARPLFFMDYFGCSRLPAGVFETVVLSAAEACGAVGCALIGGETAEMPGVYLDDEIDVVGAIVGVVDADRRLPRSKPSAGDRLVGLASNGLHTNGFSLARRALFEVGGRSVRDESASGGTYGEALLRPHKCYLSAVWPVIQEFPEVLGCAHITGGGLPGNVPRVLPADCQAVVHRRAWTPLPLFAEIQAAGGIDEAEMFRTFNMGIGMVLVVQQEAVSRVIDRLAELGEPSAEIGKLRTGTPDVQIV